MIKLSEKRNYGIDLLRLVSMLMVVTLHIIGKAELLSDVSAVPAVPRCILWVMEIASYGAVDIFVLISGYVGYRSSFRLSRMVKLYLHAFFWQIVITLAFLPTLRDAERPAFTDFFTFISDREWWFVTDYFALCLFMPMLNFLINKLPKKKLLVSLIAFVLLFSIYPPAAEQDAFNLKGGYSLIWLIIMYLIGGALAKYSVLAEKGKRFYLIWYSAMIAVTVLHRLITGYLAEEAGLMINSELLVSYTSPTIIFASMCMLGIFSQLKLPAALKKTAAVVTPCVLGVYIIHEHPYIREEFISGWTGKLGISLTAPAELIFSVFCATAAVFAACLLLDLMREYLFRLVRIPKFLDWTDAKFKELMDKINL